MKSIGAMIEQLSGLLDTKDLTDWEQGFVRRTYELYTITFRRSTASFSEKQVIQIERIWNKHFAG